jgi:hypothetical protein
MDELCNAFKYPECLPYPYVLFCKSYFTYERVSFVNDDIIELQRRAMETMHPQIEAERRAMEAMNAPMELHRRLEEAINPQRRATEAMNPHFEKGRLLAEAMNPHFKKERLLAEAMNPHFEKGRLLAEAMIGPIGHELRLAESVIDPFRHELRLAESMALGEHVENRLGFTLPPTPHMPSIAYTHQETLREVRELREDVEELKRCLFGSDDEEGKPEEEPLYGSDGVKRSPGF